MWVTVGELDRVSHRVGTSTCYSVVDHRFRQGTTERGERTVRGRSGKVGNRSLGQNKLRNECRDHAPDPVCSLRVTSHSHSLTL